MNIKDLTKNYLNTLPRLSDDEKEKIANFNASSDRIIFSAVSVGPVDIGVTEYNNPETGNLDRFSKDYGGFKKVDVDGYLLIDDSEYNPFYHHPRSVRKIPLEKRLLDGINYKRDENGYLKAKKSNTSYSAIEKSKGEEDGWERFQHLKLIDNIPVGTEVGVKTTRNGVDIKSESLSSLLEEVWNKVAGSEDGHDVGRLIFPYGAGLINTPSYLNQSRYCVLPNDKTERDKLWIMISKESFKHQTEYNYSLSFDLKDIQKKKNFKLFSSITSLMSELNGDEEITDEEYNKYIENYSSENNPIVKQFDEMISKFYKQYEEFYQKYPQLVNGIQRKFAERVLIDDTRPVDAGVWLGRKINDTDNEATKNSLKNSGRKWIRGGADMHIGKLLETIDLMEELFEAFSPKTPPNQSPDSLANFRQQSIATINAILIQEPKIFDNDLTENNRDWRNLIKNASNESQIGNIRDRVLIDIANKRKGKKQKNKISENIKTEGKSEDQLKKQLEEVEKSRGQQSYEDNQTAIANLKKELSKKITPEEYVGIIVKVVEKFLAKYQVNADELDAEIKNQWERLKGGEIKDFGQVSQVENEVLNNAGNKGAKKKLDSLFQQAKNALKTGKEVGKVKNNLNGFRLSNEIYEKTLVSQEKQKIESLLAQLENYSTNTFQNPSQGSPWTTTISIFLFVAFIIGVGIIIYRKKKRTEVNKLFE